MPRKKRPFIRKSAVRDARLIIIATEDTKATVRYLQELVSPRYYQNSKVHVEVLIRDSTASSPKHVFEQLKQWEREYQIGTGDELWIVIDVDQWGDAKISHIAQECLKKDFYLAVSNPDIELWFLLHLVDVNSYSPQQKTELFINAKVNANRTRIEQEIINIAGSYNKSNLDVARYLPFVKVAIERAEKLDINLNDRWPQQLGSRMYLLVKSITRFGAKESP